MTGFYWIASYPKSGNTWLRLFLQSLCNGGAPLDFSAPMDVVSHGATRQGFEAAMELESGDLTDDEITRARPRQYESEAAATSHPLWRKVHDCWSLTPAGEELFPPAVTLGAIYLVRDPRDVAVSFAHHNNSSIDWAITAMATPEYKLGSGQQGLPRQLPQRLGTWSEHVRSWLDAKDLHRLVIRYEDITAAPEASFTAAAAFLGLSASTAQITAATQAVRFDILRDAEERHGFAERPRYADRFFRRGIANGWRDTLTPAQIARIEADHSPIMLRLGYQPASAVNALIP